MMNDPSILTKLFNLGYAFYRLTIDNQPLLFDMRRDNLGDSELLAAIKSADKSATFILTAIRISPDHHIIETLLSEFTYHDFANLNQPVYMISEIIEQLATPTQTLQFTSQAA